MDLFDINAKLVRLYGRDTVYPQPIWRVIWSEHLIEKRESTYEDYTPAGIYLGRKTGIREVKKYSYIPNCYVLEKFHTVFTRGVYDEVKEPFSYEPVYVFLDKQNNRLPLAWRPIEMIVSTWLKGEKEFIDHQAIQAKKEADEVEKCRNIIEQDDPKWKPTFESSVSVKANEVKEGEAK